MTTYEYLEDFIVPDLGDEDNGTPEFALMYAANRAYNGFYEEATFWAAMATARQTLLNANVQHFDKY